MSIELKFNRELYSKTALIKAAYNFTDRAYLHLDADEKYFYINIENKEGQECIGHQEFENEILAQSVRHEIYKQTKHIRELLLARAMASSMIIDDNREDKMQEDLFEEDEVLKDWFDDHS